MTEKFVEARLSFGRAATSHDMEPRRLSRGCVHRAYNKGPDGFRWLRGVVVRDPKTRAVAHHITAAMESTDTPMVQPVSVDDESSKTLIDDDVVIVEGNCRRVCSQNPLRKTQLSRARMERRSEGKLTNAE